MTDHPDFDELGDHVDGLLAPARAAEVWEHLRECAQCRTAYGAIDEMVNDAAKLPRDIAPPPELWGEVRGRLSRRRHIFSIGFSPAGLAAATLLLVALSSGITALVMRDGSRAVATVETTGPTGAQPVRPANLTSAERGYAESAARLEATLAERRDSLAPATVATVERSLRIADSAIAEAHAALERDPANRAIEAILASNYQRKIDLLRRANELSPRT
jgi:hypothetical protein